MLFFFFFYDEANHEYDHVCANYDYVYASSDYVSDYVFAGDYFVAADERVRRSKL